MTRKAEKIINNNISIINDHITEANLLDEDRLKLFTGKITNIASLIESLNQNRCYIVTAESDISRTDDGDLVFAIGDKMTIGTIITYQDKQGLSPDETCQYRSVLTYVGDRFIILNK
jgi:hypothetical protein